MVFRLSYYFRIQRRQRVVDILLKVMVESDEGFSVSVQTSEKNFLSEFVMYA